MRGRGISIPKREYGVATILLLLATMNLAAADTPSSHSPETAVAIDLIENFGGSVRRVAANVEDCEVSLQRIEEDLPDEVLGALSKIPNITWVNLQKSKITDSQLQHLSEVDRLTRLHLEQTTVGDEGLEYLSFLKNLEYLNLYGTGVTDAGLKHLEGLVNLRRLYVWRTGVTEEGAAALEEKIPGLTVVLATVLTPVATAAEEKEAKPAESAANNELARGQTVRVRLSGESRLLSLAEVEVFSSTGNAALHRNGRASQSSLDFGGKADRAIDGNPDGVYAHNSVSHTKTEKDPWWQVALESPQSISRIRIWNRYDCCGDRLEGAIVEVLDAEQKVVWEKSIRGAAVGSMHEFVKQE